MCVETIKNFITRYKKPIAVGGVVASGVLLAGLLNPTPIPAEYVTAPENNTYKIGVQNYHVALAKDIGADRSLQYQLDDKYFSLKPIAIKVDGVESKTLSSSIATTNEKKYYYNDIFGEGIDLDMNFGDRIWNKIVKIDSLNRLGNIEKAENIEVWFEMETNFVIDGWNRKDKFYITDKVRLGDYSYLEPAYVWDSYSKEVCHEEQFDSCNSECTQEDELKTGCDYCDPPVEVCETQDHKQQIISYFISENGKFYYIKEIPVNWLKVAQFPVYTDLDVAYGTEAVILASATKVTRIVGVSEGAFVVCYLENVATAALNCRVGTISGNTITLGNQSTDVNADTFGNWMALCKVKDDKIALVYADDDDDDGHMRFADINTGSRTFGWSNEIEFSGNSDTEEGMRCAGIESATADIWVTGYNDEGDSNTGKTIACKDTGTISCGTPVEFDAGEDFYPKTIHCAEADGAGTYVCAFEEEDVADDVFVVVGTLDNESTLAVTNYTPVEIDSANAIQTALAVLDTDKFAVVANSPTTNDFGTWICTISGTTASCGAAGTATGRSVGYVSTINLDLDEFFIVARDNDVAGDPGIGNLLIADFDAKTFASSTSEEYSANQTIWNDVALVAYGETDTKTVVISYYDGIETNGEVIAGIVTLGTEDGGEPPAAEEEQVQNIFWF